MTGDVTGGSITVWATPRMGAASAGGDLDHSTDHDRTGAPGAREKKGARRP
jgi:hypothetical protein